ncbi:hypothetical protein M758_8G151100 [Ceratodon purpureus]|nr:hypothetical protein M758_8G151100 [Ceratodon purpureus]
MVSSTVLVLRLRLHRCLCAAGRRIETQLRWMRSVRNVIGAVGGGEAKPALYANATLSPSRIEFRF